MVQRLKIELPIPSMKVHSYLGRFSMPQIATLGNFGEVGLNTDLPPVTLPPNVLTSGNNFRINANALHRFGGDHFIATAPITPAFIFPIDSEVDLWIMFDATSAYTWDGTSFTQVDNGLVTAPNPYTWTGTHLSRIPIFANAGQSPVYWDSGTNQLEPLPYTYDVPGGTVTQTWADRNYSAASIRSFGQYLVAFNITDGGENFPDMVHWSHHADLSDLPYSWETIDPNTVADRFSLGGGGGDIIDGYALRNGVAVYRERGLTSLDATQDNNVFSVRHITEVVNLPNVRSIVEVKGVHFILTYDDIVANDGNEIRSICHNKIRHQYAREFNADNSEKVFSVLNTNGKEIWFCIAVSDSIDRAYVFNYRDSSWSFRELPGIQHAGLGPINSDVRTWDSWSETWDTASGTWDQGRTHPTDKTIIAVSGNAIRDLDGGTSDFPINTFVERTNLPLEGHDKVTTLVRAYPHIKGSNCTIRLGSQDVVNGPVNWQPAIQFRPGIDRKIDIRTTGRLHAYKIESVDIGSLSISGMDLEYELAGRR